MPGDDGVGASGPTVADATTCADALDNLTTCRRRCAVLAGRGSPVPAGDARLQS
jgi:glycerate-2-kinase